MDKINVLTVSRMHYISPDYMADITAVDPSISVKDGAEQFVTELRQQGKSGPLVDRLEKEVGVGRVTAASENLDTLLAEAEVIFGTMLFPDELLSRAPRLKWIHTSATGVERYLSSGTFGSNVIITNSKGANAIPIAEHTLSLIFMLAKNAPRLLANKQARKWERFYNLELNGRTLGIVGLGAIGTEIAKLAKGIGMRVIATRRSATKRELDVFGVAELYPRTELLQMLSESDFVVIAAPLTEETRGMIGKTELQAMKPAAYLVNIARGEILDQAALIKALKEGWIAGTGLDVFETEPLPTNNELWELPNAIVSPHIATWTDIDRRSRRIIDLFCKNLRSYVAGEPLLNVVDKEKGY